jgi:hypothetical protein
VPLHQKQRLAVLAFSIGKQAEERKFKKRLVGKVDESS